MDAEELDARGLNSCSKDDVAVREIEIGVMNAVLDVHTSASAMCGCRRMCVRASRSVLKKSVEGDRERDALNRGQSRHHKRLISSDASDYRFASCYSPSPPSQRDHGLELRYKVAWSKTHEKRRYARTSTRQANCQSPQRNNRRGYYRLSRP